MLLDCGRISVLDGSNCKKLVLLLDWQHHATQFGSLELLHVYFSSQIDIEFESYQN